MKKRDFILILMIIVLAGLVWVFTSVFHKDAGGSLRITVDGQEYGVFELNQERDIEIGDTNICQIRDGHVSMIYGECPDQVCVHSMSISKKGQTIICMPNRVVLEVIAGDKNQIDTIVE